MTKLRTCVGLGALILVACGNSRSDSTESTGGSVGGSPQPTSGRGGTTGSGGTEGGTAGTAARGGDSQSGGSAIAGGQAGDAGSPSGGVNVSGAGGGNDTDGCGRAVGTMPADDDMHEWLVPRTLPGSAWRSLRGIHLGFAAVYRRDDPAGGRVPMQRIAFILQTFDPSGGALLRERIFDVFPPTIADRHAEADGVAASPEGRFIFTYQWADPDTSTLVRRAWIGDLDDDTVQVEVDLGAGAPAALLSQAGWDGEAFVVHAYETNESAVYSLRFTANGELLRGFEPFGAGMGRGFGEAGHRVVTNPVSRVSAAANLDNFAAHGPYGERLAWIPEEGYAQIDVVQNVASAPVPRVSVDDAGGAWIIARNSYLNDNNAGVAHVTADGEEDVNFAVDGFAPSYFAPLARPDGTAWFALASFTQIVGRTFDGMTLGAPELVFNGKSAIETTVGPYELAAFAWRDETWISFYENRTDINHFPQALLVRPGCVYEALPGP